MNINKRFLTSAIIGTVVGGCVCSYPAVLRWQVEKRLPGIEFDDVSMSTSGITLSGVKLDKGWIKGELNTVTSDFSGQNVTIDGGSLNVNLNDKQNRDGIKQQKRDIQFKDLNVNVVYKEYVATLDGVKSEQDQICFTTAKLKNPELTASSGCFNKDKKTINLKTVSITKDMELMGVNLNDLVANNVSVNINEKTIASDITKATLTFEKQTFSIEMSELVASQNPDVVRSNSVKIKHPWLSNEWVIIEDVKAHRMKDAWSISAGLSDIQINPEMLTFSGSEDCSTWIESLPASIKSGPLNKLRMAGKTSFSIGFRPKPSFNLKSDCRATCNTLPNLRTRFHYSAYTPHGVQFERESGIGSKDWLSIRSMGDMPLAAINMEDPGFEHHRGFIVQAFMNSFTENIKAGRFYRGGSTITMQLAKNLWLSRDKTLGRKVQEFFLSQAIESCYSKDEILELYLNVVEFGPNQYGIASGTKYWFKKGVGELNPIESFWMASILPRPNKAGHPTDVALQRIESLMKRFAADGKIPDFTLDVVDDEVEVDDFQIGKPEEN